MVLTNIFIMTLLPRQAEAIVLVRSEILAHGLQQQSAMKLAVDLENATKEQAQIYQSLPNKDGLLEVIKILESLKEVTQVRNFAFEGDAPIKDSNGFAFFPLAISLEGSLEQTMTALTRLQRTPYLFTVDQTTLEITEGETPIISVKVFMRLYVSEPFAQN